MLFVSVLFTDYFFFLMIRRPPRSTQSRSSAASDVYKRQFPAGVIASTTANLQESANGEKHEYAEMYPSFAEVAKKEGFSEIAETFLNIARAEMGHEKRFLTLKKNIDEGAVFKRGDKVVWRCRNCGYMHEGNEAPSECPACKHEQAYFEVFG